MEQRRLLRCHDDGRQTNVAPNILYEAVLNVSAAALFISVEAGGKAGRRLGWRTSLFRSSASDVVRSRHAGHIHNSYNALNQRKRLAELFLPAEVYR